MTTIMAGRSRTGGGIEAVLIAGPTASGKSRLALGIADALGGVVVNADSMQVYQDLRILTARPSEADLAAVPHALYGHVPPDRPYSTGEWLREAGAVLSELRDAGQVPIVCGGTGLYFRALLGGIDDMPPVDPALRDGLRRQMADEGPEALHAVLAGVDAQAAARIEPTDPQRILRALEIAATMGAPLSALQRGMGVPLVDASRSLKIVLTPPRDILRARISERFRAMMEAGALEEARAFASLPGALESTAGKAIGVTELTAYLSGAMSLEQAVDRSVTRSRQYAKRQDTWFRHQLGPDWRRIEGLEDIDPADLLAGPAGR